MLSEEGGDGGEGDAGGLLQREVIDPGGDGGKVHGLAAVLDRKRQTASVAGGQQRLLPVAAAVPDGAGGVDDEAGGQAVAPGDLRLAGAAAVQRAAFRQQLRPCGPMDGAVHSAPAQKTGVGGVDDGVRGLFGNVALDDLDTVHAMYSFFSRRDCPKTRCHSERSEESVLPGL